MICTACGRDSPSMLLGGFQQLGGGVCHQCVALADAMQEPIYFLSGFYFPVRSLGAVVGGVGSLIPLTLGLDAIRQLILPGTPQFIPLPVEVLAVVAQIIAYAVLSQISLRYLERQARQDARLILRST